VLGPKRGTLPFVAAVPLEGKRGGDNFADGHDGAARHQVARRLDYEFKRAIAALTKGDDGMRARGADGGGGTGIVPAGALQDLVRSWRAADDEGDAYTRARFGEKREGFPT
jgi:hypothetical protein